jgi:hypothetical protein
MKRARLTAPMAPLRLGPNSSYRFDPKLGEPDGPRSNIPRMLLRPDHLRKLLTFCPHLIVLSTEYYAIIIGVFKVHSATETLPEWLTQAVREAMRSGHAYLLCGTNVEAVEQVGQRLLKLCHGNNVVTIPAPLRQGEKLYHFAPSLIATGHIVRDGTSSLVRLPIAETLDCCVCSVVISQRNKAAIIGMWLVPPEWPVPLPESVAADARAAVRNGNAYLLCGVSEIAVEQAAARLAAMLPDGVV